MTTRWHMIVDANNICAINAHAHEELSHNGVKTGGLYGTLRKVRMMLLEDLSDYDISSVTFVNDAGRPAFRTKLCPEYKSGRTKNRTAEKDEFHEAYTKQMRMLPSFLSPLGISSVSVNDWEADDVIAWLTMKVWAKENIIIVSGDKDFVQLAKKDRVHIYRPSQKNDEIIKRCPSGYLLRRCLMGDPSDTIKGVKGIGEGRAIEILHDAKEAKGKALFTTPDELFEGYDGKFREKYLDVNDAEKIVRRNWKIMSLRISAKKMEKAKRDVKLRVGKLDTAEFRDKCKTVAFSSLIGEGEAFLRPFIDLVSKGERLGIPH